MKFLRSLSVFQRIYIDICFSYSLYRINLLASLRKKDVPTNPIVPSITMLYILHFQYLSFFIKSPSSLSGLANNLRSFSFFPASTKAVLVSKKVRGTVIIFLLRREILSISFSSKISSYVVVLLISNIEFNYSKKYHLASILNFDTPIYFSCEYFFFIAFSFKLGRLMLVRIMHISLKHRFIC